MKTRKEFVYFFYISSQLESLTINTNMSYFQSKINAKFIVCSNCKKKKFYPNICLAQSQAAQNLQAENRDLGENNFIKISVIYIFSILFK